MINDSKKDSNGNALVVLVLGVLLVGGLGLYFLSKRVKDTSMEMQDTQVEDMPKEVDLPIAVPNFKKEGTLLIVADLSGNWIILHDEPGNPAASKILKLDSESMCNYGKREEVCNKEKFTYGTQIELVGVEKDGQVTVVTLRYL